MILEKMTKAQIIEAYHELYDKFEEASKGYHTQKTELENLRGMAIEKDAIEFRIGELDAKVRDLSSINVELHQRAEGQLSVINDLKTVVINQSAALASIAGMKRAEQTRE